MCYASNEKRQTKPDRRNGTPKSNKIRTFGKKETYKYLGILEADTIKQVEMKEKLRKNISGKLESYSRQNYVAETLSKVYIPGLYTLLYIRDNFEVDQRRT